VKIARVRLQDLTKHRFRLQRRAALQMLLALCEQFRRGGHRQ
jgi:hypothetical protein